MAGRAWTDEELAYLRENHRELSCGQMGAALGRRPGVVRKKLLRMGLSLKFKHVTHGMTGTRVYRTWKQMRGRCSNPNTPGWKDYGGRGIRVCPEWQTFEAFHEWATASGYRDDLEIDRIDFNGNYEPCNCRWVDGVTQCNNTRANRRITAWGETKTLMQWSRDERCVISWSLLKSRLNKGEEPEEAMTRPTHDLITLEAFGEEKPLIEWANDPRCRVTTSAVRQRLKGGWPPEKALSVRLRG